MEFDYTQVFLLIWMVAFWGCYILTYGKVEAKYERSLSKKYGAPAKWGLFFGLAFLGWTVVSLIYFFHIDFINWIWTVSFLDYTAAKIVGVVLMSLAFLLNLLFTVSVARPIREAVAEDGESKLVTSGIYHYVRHPGYLAFFVATTGGVLIIPNVITLVLLLYTYVVTYGHTLEEEKKLLRMYGEEYEEYMEEAGRYLPKLR